MDSSSGFLLRCWLIPPVDIPLEHAGKERVRQFTIRADISSDFVIYVHQVLKGILRYPLEHGPLVRRRAVLDLRLERFVSFYFHRYPIRSVMAADFPVGKEWKGWGPSWGCHVFPVMRW
jgi:hypothetical protein